MGEDRMLDGEKWRIKKVMILLFKAKELLKRNYKDVQAMYIQYVMSLNLSLKAWSPRDPAWDRDIIQVL